MKKQFGFLICSALLLGASFTSCKKEEAPKKYAKINITHASPGNYDVNFVSGSDTLNGKSPLGYYNHTGYQNIEAGSRIIKLYYAGKDSFFVDSTFNFKEDQHYSLYLIDSPNVARPLLVADDLNKPANGKAHVRFVYLALNSPTVDIIRMVDTNSNLLFPIVSFRDVTSFTEFDPGVYNFEMKQSGTKTTLLKVPTLVLNNGRTYTIVTRGIVGTNGKTEYKSDVFINKM